MRLTTGQRLAVLWLSGMMAAACSSSDVAQPALDPIPPTQEPELAEPIEPEPPKPLRRPVRRLPQVAARPPATAPIEESPAVVEEAPPPARLVGLSEKETVGLLGEPQTRTDWAPARLWLYRAPDCELELSFFYDVSRNGFYVLDFAARDTRGENDSRDRCLRSVQDERRSR